MHHIRYKKGQVMGAPEVTEPAKRKPGRPRKDTTMAAQNADDSKTNNAGLPEAQEGTVTIEATTRHDLHLGDERVIYGDGDGVHGETDSDTGEAFAFPNRAKVTKEIADMLVKSKQAKRV